MGKWDNQPIETVIKPPLDPLDDNGTQPTDKLGAVMFVIWSVIMMGLGALIYAMVQGHIVLR